MDNKDFKILFLDDEKDIVEVLAKIFSMHGFTTFEAINSDEALEIFNRENPQICVFDIYLVDSTLDGIETFEEIRKGNKDTVGIFFSRITEDDIIKRANALGIFDFLVKPFKPSDLRAVIEKAVETLKA
jgi:DNA-binding response OmpR family regulator